MEVHCSIVAFICQWLFVIFTEVFPRFFCIYTKNQWRTSLWAVRLLIYFTEQKEVLAFFYCKCYCNLIEVKHMEWNDVYDDQRRLTGRRRLRSEHWEDGEYGLAVCCWVYDGKGNVLLTQRAPEKLFPLTWENSGGAAQAGETSRQAMSRELFEETGIFVPENEFEFLETTKSNCMFFDHYCICRHTPLEQIRLQPGETVDARWVSFDEAYQLTSQMCEPIRRQFLHFAPLLRAKQNAQF